MENLNCGIFHIQYIELDLLKEKISVNPIEAAKSIKNVSIKIKKLQKYLIDIITHLDTLRDNLLYIKLNST